MLQWAKGKKEGDAFLTKKTEENKTVLQYDTCS